MFAAVRIKRAKAWGMRAARPCGRLVVQVRVESEIGLDLAVGDDDVRFVALIHLDPVGVEFVFFERNRGVERVALRFRLRRGAAAGVHVGFDLFGAVILMGLDPVPSILLAGVAALVIAVPTGLFRVPPERGLFCHRHVVDHRRSRTPAGGAVENAGRRDRHVSAA
jgi:hypothetical protein